MVCMINADAIFTLYNGDIEDLEFETVKSTTSRIDDPSAQSIEYR